MSLLIKAYEEMLANTEEIVKENKELEFNFQVLVSKLQAKVIIRTYNNKLFMETINGN